MKGIYLKTLPTQTKTFRYFEWLNTWVLKAKGHMFSYLISRYVIYTFSIWWFLYFMTSILVSSYSYISFYMNSHSLHGDPNKWECFIVLSLACLFPLQDTSQLYSNAVSEEWCWHRQSRLSGLVMLKEITLGNSEIVT